MLPKTRVYREYPSTSWGRTPSHSLGHSQDEFNFQDVAGSPVQERRMCSLPSVAKLYCGSLLPTAEPKDLKDSDLGPSKPCSAPWEGRGGLCCPLLSLRKAREPHGIAKSALASGTASAALACHRPKYFYDLGGTFYLASFIFITGKFYCLNFLRRQSFKWFYYFFFFSRHLWVLTRYIIYG